MKVVIKTMGGEITVEQEHVDELRDSFPDDTFVVAVTDEDERREIVDADVFAGFPSRETLLAAQRLRWIGYPGTGVDNLASMPELVESDIVLTNTRGPHAAPMADHVIGMMLNLAHRWREHFEDQRDHRWDSPKYYDTMVELAGSTLGILSMGDIGTQVAQRARGFDMKVYGVDKFPKPSPLAEEVWGLDRLDDLLQMSDWLVVTTPLTPETRGLLDRRRIGLLKDGAYIIIISRGHIVDEAALYDELKSGRLGGAGIDAVAQEPLPPDSPFWDLDNVVITPHSSAASVGLIPGRRAIFRENLRRFHAGEPFLYVVNKKAGF